MVKTDRRKSAQPGVFNRVSADKPLTLDRKPQRWGENLACTGAPAGSGAIQGPHGKGPDGSRQAMKTATAPQSKLGQALRIRMIRAALNRKYRHSLINSLANTRRRNRHDHPHRSLAHLPFTPRV